MRLIVTILWLIAALCWLPWFAMLMALLVDTATGTPWRYCNFVPHAMMGLWPGVGMDLLSPATWLRWRIVSMYPVCAFTGILLSAGGWRTYWREQDGTLTRPPLVVALSILVPPVAPFLMWGDARQRHLKREYELDQEVAGARERLAAEDR